MGLKNAPAWFSRMMTIMLGELIDKSCMMYMDDVISFASTLLEALKSLREIFRKLREMGMKLQPDKCDFLNKTCLFLGHKVTQDGILPDESKLDSIKNFKQPMNKKNVRSFLGLTGFYRKFIKDFGRIAAPLHKLTSPLTEFKWEEKHRIAFEELKEKLITPPVLAHPLLDKDFILTTDASGTGIAGVLSQIQDGKEKPIGYCSRALRPREATFAKDNATETELLAICWAAKYFRPYLYGKHFTVYTDNKALVSLNKMNNDNIRLMKYKQELEEFDFTVKHISGKKNVVADALSRMYLTKVVTDPLDKERILGECHDNVLAGHKGAEPTLKKIKEAGFTWNGIRRDVKDYVAKCESCQKNKLYGRTKLPMVITDTPSRPLQKMAVDLVEELPATAEGYKHLLTAQDNFSKFIWAVPLRTKSADEVAKAFAEEIVLKHGIPEVVLSDQGTNFLSKIFKQLCKTFGIEKIQTSSHRPQSNGSLERWHRSMKEYFRHYIANDQRNWVDLIPIACFAHNTTVHSVTAFTPFEIFHGFKANVPSSLRKKPSQSPVYTVDDYAAVLKTNVRNAYKVVEENLGKGKVVNKNQYDKKAKHIDFKVGQHVKLLAENVRQGRSKSLEPKWLGPYTVIECKDGNYKIKMGRKTKVVHGDKLKDYY